MKDSPEISRKNILGLNPPMSPHPTINSRGFKSSGSTPNPD